MQKANIAKICILTSLILGAAAFGRQLDQLTNKSFSGEDVIGKSDKCYSRIDLYKNALAKAEALKKNDASVAVILYRMGTICLSTYKYSEAKKCFAKCVSILEQLPNDKRLDLDLASALIGLGDVSPADTAQIYFSKALAIQRKLLHAEDPELGTTQYKLACALYHLNRYEEALPLYHSAKSIFAKHGLTIETEVEVELAACCVRLGYYDEALKSERLVTSKLQEGHRLKMFAHTVAHYLYDMVDGYLDRNKRADAQRNHTLACTVTNKYKHEMPDGQLLLLSAIDKLYRGQIPSAAELKRQPLTVTSNSHYMQLLHAARMRQKKNSTSRLL